jgi:hypothetical protein
MQKRKDTIGAKATEPQQYEAHLSFSVHIDDWELSSEEKRPPVTLIGYTQSIGADSLSLIGPFYQFGYCYVMGSNRTLQVTVELPTGTINIQGFPMRYTKVREDQIKDGYMLTGPDMDSFGETEVICLIEVSIVVMSDSDRALLSEYLKQLGHIEVECIVLPSFMERPQRPAKAPAYAAA